MAHAVDLLVDGGFLLDIGVGARDVGFRLIIVVIGDEILDRVVGEELLELGVELRRQRLVWREDQGRALRLLDHLGHGEGFSRAGDAEQHLRAVLVGDAFDEVLDRGRLVAGRLEVGLHLDSDAAFGFLRAFGAVRRPQDAVLVQRVAALDQVGQRLDGGGDAAVAQRLGIFQRNIEAGDGIQAGRRALLGRGRAAHGRAACGARGGGGTLRNLFRWLCFGRALFDRLAVALRFLRNLLGPVRDRPGQRSASEFGLRRLGEPLALQRFGGVQIVGHGVAALARWHAVILRRARRPLGGFGHAQNMGGVRANGKSRVDRPRRRRASS